MPEDAAAAVDEIDGEDASTVSLLSPAGPTPPPDLTGKTVYAIDANSLIFQVFHAIPEMTSPRGEPVNAVFGFTRDLLFLLEKKKPDYLFCAFDMSGPTFRHDLYDGYKGQRSEMPSELRPQFPSLRRMIAALQIPILELEGFEADDVLATLAQLTHDAGGECYLVTGDKDCRQLITDRVVVYNVRKDLMYDAGALAADWGIRPDQVVDYQAIVGDSVDNVPGIPLIGPKIARELLNKYDTLEGIFEHAGEIAGTKRRENVINGREQALLSRQLVRLDTNTPIAIDWSAAQRRPLNPDRALALCAGFGFHRFAEQLRAGQSASQAKAWRGDYQAIDTAEKLAAWLPQLPSRSRVAISVIASGPVTVQADVAAISLAWTPGEAWYLPLGADEETLGAAPGGGTALAPHPILSPEGRGVMETDQPRGAPEARSRGDARGLEAVLRKRAHRENLAAREAGHPAIGQCRHRAARLRLRHDAGQLPARCRRAEPHARRAIAALSRPYDDDGARFAGRHVGALRRPWEKKRISRCASPRF